MENGYAIVNITYMIPLDSGHTMEGATEDLHREELSDYLPTNDADRTYAQFLNQELPLLQEYFKQQGKSMPPLEDQLYRKPMPATHDGNVIRQQHAEVEYASDPRVPAKVYAAENLEDFVNDPARMRYLWLHEAMHTVQGEDEQATDQAVADWVRYLNTTDAYCPDANERIAQMAEHRARSFDNAA